MDGKKEIKIDDECLSFNEEWGIKYFLIQSNAKDKALYLIYKDSFIHSFQFIFQGPLVTTAWRVLG
jgi:hypothetical protein